MFDTNAALKRTSYMWRKLGGLYEKAAYDAIAKALPNHALACARIAEVCFFQATGDGSALEMKDVIKPEAGQ